MKTIDRTFPETLSALRKEKTISQRKAAADLGISQALLSHYENGLREPGLAFLCKACDYYGVSADYLLCRTEYPDAAGSAALAAGALLSEMRTIVDRAQGVLDEYYFEGSGRQG